ncbi:MAG TPA: lipocalin family protein [Flavisolibacter sp.]|nr:lipocalin family protein [Flavisolibacter sp.]
MKKLFFILLIPSLSLIFNSCTKSASASIDVTAAITYQLVAGTYKTTSIVAKDNSSGSQFDLYAQMSSCQKDDTEILSPDGTYYYVDAGTKCNPIGDSTGSWTLNANKITIGSINASIQSYDGQNLVVTYTQTNGSSTYTVTQKFVRQ